MMRLPRLIGGFLMMAFAGAACTFPVGDGTLDGSPSALASIDSTPSPIVAGPGSAAAAMRELCVAPQPVGGSQPAEAGDVPAAIAEVEQQVQTVRGLVFEHPVAVTPLSQTQIDERLTRAFDKTYPAELYDRRTLAWRAMGVIAPDDDIREALLAFQTGQVVGFYNPQNGRLVYAGDTDLDLAERFTLAHELTHAVDDQHFDLSRLDEIAARCADEELLAALGAVEGSAQFFATAVVTRFPQGDLGVGAGAGGGGGSVAGVPAFIVALQLWPYTTGQAFMAALDERGGTQEQDRAVRELPASTEQVLHPERYPNDLPQGVDVPDLSNGLGHGWRNLDVMQVGEEFLREMLRLRLDQGTADAAAAGWDGGMYRAWSNGDRVAVVLSTVWDSPGDAGAFVEAMNEWFDAGETSGFALQGRDGEVRVGFATDATALDALRQAMAQ